MSSRSASAPSCLAPSAGLRKRPDLAIRPQQVGGRRYWVVKDPVALKYFHLRDEEHAILQMLDGRISFPEIKRRFEQAFAPLQMNLEHLQAFLARLHQCGLVLSEAPRQGDELLSRHERMRRQARLQTAAGVLAVRFGGIDPEPLLRWLYPRCRWMSSAGFLGGCLVTALAAVLLVAMQFGRLQAKLPDFHAFFSAQNVLGLAVALAAVKVLHELGHGLTCKHFGGECHQMGLMLLVFTPCLYCDVSDAWMLRSKWHRIAVSAAGMGVEIVLAAAATFLWWFSEPGRLNTLCLNVMFVCSVSTVVFNGNPLLRYDGYYILSDLVEVPNLYQQARAVLGRALSRWFLGIRLPEDRSLPEKDRGLLALYAVGSTLYRWAVVIAIVWFCHKVLQPYRLELLAGALAVVVVISLLIAPLAGGARSLRNPAWRARIRRGRALLSAAVLIAALLAIGLVPLPFRVAAAVRLEPEDGHRVYVSVAGRLAGCVPAAAAVRKGQTLANLENLDLRRQVEDLVGQRNRQRLHLKHLELRLAADPSVALQIPAAREALADIEQRLLERRRDEHRLVLKSPADGTVLPPPRIAAPRYAPSHRWQIEYPPPNGPPETWHGSPLQPRNLGCYLTTGTLFCLVGNRPRLEAVLVIEQAGLKFVRVGQRVRIQLHQLPGKVLGGTVREIATTELKALPDELATGQELPVRVGRRGTPLPAETSYQARVQLDDHEHTLLTGARGRAKILADPQPLCRRVWRYLQRTFSITL